MIRPSLRLERALFRAGNLIVAGVDEVGRGALAGPVSVGVVLLDASVRSATPGLRDSKLLTPRAREDLMPKLMRWPLAWAVGHAEAAEIDALGIIACLRLAAARAFAQLPQRPDVAILDGPYDYLRVPGSGDDSQLSLFDLRDATCANAGWDRWPTLVITKVKADLTCSSVAAASVFAKVTRDRLMIDRARSAPEYVWQENKGYASPEHLLALHRLGPSPQHRQSWRLPCPTPVAGLELAGFRSDPNSVCEMPPEGGTAAVGSGPPGQPRELSTVR